MLQELSRKGGEISFQQSEITVQFIRNLTSLNLEEFISEFIGILAKFRKSREQDPFRVIFDSHDDLLLTAMTTKTTFSEFGKIVQCFG